MQPKDTSYSIHIAGLIRRHQQGELSENEQAELHAWIEADPDNRKLFLDLHSEQYLESELKKLELSNVKEGWQRVQDKMALHKSNKERSSIPMKSFFRYTAAVILLVGGYWIYRMTDDRKPITGPGNKLRATVIADVAPATNRATLAIDNKTIDLSNNKTGIAIGEAIAYNDGERIADAGKILELTTPRGGQYQAVLPDGSKVWLNAASGITFPSKFAGDKREVKITGEVYLEVAKKAKQPFLVHTDKTTIEVLGTSFNINAYGDAPTEKATLMDGSIRVISKAKGVSSFASKSIVLRPAQQAIIDDQGILCSYLNHSQDVIAWKNGYFVFHDNHFRQVLQELSRWYNIDIRYRNDMDPTELNQPFTGEISRDVPLSKVLQMMQMTGVATFKVDVNTNTVTVLPYIK